MDNLWIEKHRPSTFSEVKGQTNIVKRLKAMVQNKNIPHLLFAGPAGVGKTTLAIIIAKELFKDKWKENFLELNASDARGIDTIRNDVKDFARTKSISTNLPKIIFLDESDALTREAQQALRRTMESFSQTVRFILSCNYSSKIIDPIQSRCTIFRFKKLDKNDIKELVQEISKKENLKINNEIIDSVYELSEGDARKASNILQSSASINKKITNDLIYEVVSAAKPKEINEVLNIAIKGDFVKARDKLLEVMLLHGLSGLDVIKQIQKLVWDLKIPNEQKINLIDKCGDIEFRLVEGSDEFVQIEALLASFCLIK